MMLVTGSEGFLGRNIRAVAEARSIPMVGIDRVFRGYKYPELPYDLDHCTDKDFDGATSVVHCAAHADIRNNWSPGAADDIKRDNIDALLRTLELSARAGVKRFVFISTAAVYAGYTANDLTEDVACRATSPYAASKLAGEAYVQAYAEKYGWGYWILRPAAMFGKYYAHGHVADFVRQVRETGKIHALDDGRHEKPALNVADCAELCVSLAFGSQTRTSGVYNLQAPGHWQLWNWRKTIQVMQCMKNDIVEHAWEGSQTGWLGDSNGFTMCTDKLGVGSCSHKVHDGVLAALTYLGWPL